MAHSKEVELLIIGSGPAALTAAIYAARASIDLLVAGGVMPGGQLMNTTAVENWPGEISVLGPDLVKRLKEHAVHYGAQILNEEVTEADLEKMLFTTNKETVIKAKAVIIATGAVPKLLNCPGERDYWGKGVTTCAVCDGAFYKNRPVLVVGGGDTAVENATFLSRFTHDITMVQILPELTASQIMAERVLDHPDIKILYEHEVKEIKGDGKKVTQVVIQDVRTGKVKQITTDGVFVSVGLKPNSQLFSDQLELTQSGHIALEEHSLTSRPGVFVAGDVADARYRQAITAAGMGCAAALDAERYLMKHA